MLPRMTTTTTILVAEDEPAIADAVLYALRSEGFGVEHHLLGGDVVARIEQGGIDLLLLDVGLPDINGFDVCRRVRMVSDLPVVFLTARNDEVDRVLGLELGGDDYIAKPFSPRELVARVRARLRRHAPAEQGGQRGTLPIGRRQSGMFEIDRDAHRIRFAGQLLDLTRYEYALLSELLRRPGAILSRGQLLDRAWDGDSDSADRTVDTHVKTLRAKLRAIEPLGDPIRTHRGIGYSLEIE